MSITQYTPNSVINTGLRIYTTVMQKLQMNVQSYRYKNVNFKYEYTDTKSFKEFRNIMAGDMLIRENVPLHLLERDADCDAVIDVGAHYGIYSVILGKLNPNAQLYAYEPANEPMYRLQRNLVLNDLWFGANVYDNVVSDQSGDEIPFYIDDRQGAERHSTTAKEGMKQTLRRTVALSDVFDAESLTSPFIKIDAEGMEGRIVDDLVKETATDSLSGLIEFHPDKLQEYTTAGILDTLRESGYHVDFVCESAPSYKYDRPIYYFKST